ncbi:Rrf2 family transcriptional regulator [bacterium]|nr:Rrf2 family transcriptional regulator [bacterium]
MFKLETRYALHAAVVLAGNDALVPNARLAERLGVSLPMVAKIMNRLVQAQVVVSRPGPGGGYALARPAERIRLLEVVAPTEGDDWGQSCLLGLAACDDEHPCALHGAWGRLREHIQVMLRERTVAEMAAGVVDLDLKVVPGDVPQA